jgi:hypothetical protein
MKQLKEGKVYRNCYTEKNFTVADINKTKNTCIVQYEDEEPIVRTYDMIRGIVNKSIELEMPGFEINLNTKGAEWFAVVKHIQARCNQPDDYMQKIVTALRERYYTDRTIPDEWKTDIDLLEEMKVKLQKGLSKNFWIYTLPDKVKGTLMQKLYFSFMETVGKEVSRNENQDYDAKVQADDGRWHQKEVKMATVSNGTVQFFQIRQFQEWDDLVFIVVLPNELRIYEASKDDFMNFVESNPDFQNWAGGKEKKERLNNDIRKNDLFHFNVNSLDILEWNFTKIFPTS